MWASNQASGLIGRTTSKLWGRKWEVVPYMIICPFIPHSDCVRSTLNWIHSFQSTRVYLFKKHLCFSKPHNVLIRELTGLFGCLLGQSLWCNMCMFSSILFVYECINRDRNEAHFAPWVLWFDWLAQQLHTKSPCLLINFHPQLIRDCLICFPDIFSVFVSCGICLISSK